MTKTIRVLHILYELRSSGAEIMLKNAAPYWKKKGVTLHVLSTAQEKGVFADNLDREGIIIHHIPFTNSLIFFFRLYNFFQQYQFDVVQIHVEQTFLTYSIIARLTGIPIIIRTIHSTFLFEGLTKFNRLIRRWIVRIIGVIQVSISAAVQENEQKRYHNPTLKICNWYDDSYFYPPSYTERAGARKTLNVSDDQKIVISIGNCSPVKNHESIIRALPLLNQEKFHIEYWHIGEEDDEKLEQNLVKEININSKVKFWGRQDDVRVFLWAADVYIMPSLHEGFGLAFLEAYATGIPVILAKTQGLNQWASILSDIYFSETNSTDLSSIITHVIKETSIRRNVDTTFLSSKYGINQGVEKYFGLYSK